MDFVNSASAALHRVRAFFFLLSIAISAECCAFFLTEKIRYDQVLTDCMHALVATGTEAADGDVTLTAGVRQLAVAKLFPVSLFFFFFFLPFF